MSHGSYEAAMDKIMLQASELDAKNMFSKIDIEKLEDRIEELKKEKFYLILFGVAIGALITIVIIHYT